MSARATKQLDIIADTALGKHPGYLTSVASAKTPGDLSTTVAVETPRYLSTKPENKTPGDLSTTLGAETPRALSIARMRAIERERQAVRVAIPALCAAARLHPDSYRELRRGNSVARLRTLDRLKAALRQLSAGESGSEPATLCLALIRTVTVQMALQAGADPAIMLAQDFSHERPTDPDWKLAARLRRCAVYLLVEGLGIGKSRIAGAIGVSRQAVQKTVLQIEGERDSDSAFDALLRAMMLQLTGQER